MNILRIFFEAYKKNIRRMFKSKAMLTSIFIGPFIILLLIQSAYNPSNSIDLRIGVVSPDAQNELIKTLQNQGFEVYAFTYLGVCTSDIKKGYLDFCIDLTSPEITEFYVDESKIALVDILKRIIANTIESQSSDIRKKIADELQTGLASSTSSVNSLTEGMASLQNRNPISMLRGLSSSIKSGTLDIDKAVSDLNALEREVTTIYRDTSDDLNDFSRWLNEIESKAINQRQTIMNIEQYNKNCESRLNIDENYLRTAPYDEIKNQFTVYGQCKCVDFYRPNILSIQNDLTEVISKINSAKGSVSDAHDRNNDFYNSVTNMINVQRQALLNKKSSAQTSASNMDSEIIILEQQMNALTSAVASLSSNSGKISELTGNLEYKLVNPININVNTISKKYDVIVYLFPMMYFFILVFISLLFSGVFTFSEIHSNAKQRNVLSPANHLLLLSSMFFSLLTLILVQGTLLVILGKIAFSFPLSLAIFWKLMIITLIVISLYIMLGIFIGTILNSQLMVTFIIIGISIISLLYSELLIPSNIMTSFAQGIVSMNPFSIGIETASKVILYDVEFNVFYESLIIVGCTFILLSIFTYIFYLKKISED